MYITGDIAMVSLEDVDKLPLVFFKVMDKLRSSLTRLKIVSSVAIFPQLKELEYHMFLQAMIHLSKRALVKKTIVGLSLL